MSEAATNISATTTAPTTAAVPAGAPQQTTSTVQINGQMMSVSSIERKICDEIRKAEVELKEKYPILKKQDFLGMTIFVVSMTMLIFSMMFYYQASQWFPTISYGMSTMIVMINFAFWTSMLHELEHDLIHNLYFKSHRWVQDVMFFFIWISKLHGNPWFRRDLHLKHHIISGQTNDAEERLIGLGLPLGWKRMAVTIHPVGSTIVTMDIAKDCEFLSVKKMNQTSAPVVGIFVALFKLFSLYVFLQAAVAFYDAETAEMMLSRYPRLWSFIWDINMIMVIPNIVRQSSLQLMSNITHYYGDIPDKSVYYQNQILDHWICVPFQLLCCNFGATHIVHHYVPNQAYYIRSLVYYKVKKFMVEHGVRHNDLGIVLRGNRYFMTNDDAVKHGIKKNVELQSTVASSILKHFPAALSMPIWCISFVTVGYPLFFVFDALSTLFLTIQWYQRYTAHKLRMKTL